MKSILDKSFRYVPSGQTDVRKTIARERKRLAEQARREPADQHESRQTNVQPMPRRVGK